jgi:hypothetical protein
VRAGRRNHLGEERCDYPAIPFDPANKAEDAVMRSDFTHEWMRVTTGGDSGRQIELQRIQDEMTGAINRKDMSMVTTLAAKFAEVDSRPAEPIRTVHKKTGRIKADAWESGTLADQRTMLGDFIVTVYLNADGTERENGRCLRHRGSLRQQSGARKNPRPHHHGSWGSVFYVAARGL